MSAKSINELNSAFYDSFPTPFDAIPFEPLLPDLLLKYSAGPQTLEIGSGPGTLAAWLAEKGYEVSCIEPAKKFVEMALERKLKVYPVTIQEFQTDQQYDNIIAISSLIHLSKKEMPSQIEKIAGLLKSGGVFFVSFIEGEGEGLEDPTNRGKSRFFSKWKESELDELLAAFFKVIESHKISNKEMDRTFILKVCRLKNSQ